MRSREGSFDAFVEAIPRLADPKAKGPPKKETLRDAMERVGLEASTCTIMCAQLDIAMVRAQAENKAFWEDIAGAEWAMTLVDGQMDMFVLNLKLICDASQQEQAKGVIIPSIKAMLAELPDPTASVTAEPGDKNYWPFPSFTVAELRLEPAHRRKARAQEKKKTNMRKFKVLAKMTAAQAGALDTEKREKDAIIAAKQKIIEDRRQAEKDEEERQKAAAIEALGIDAIGPRPAKEPGEFHQLVDATEHHVPGAFSQTYGSILTLIFTC